ncbi:MAG: DUF7518 family protein [Halobacteriota archaeon]
MTEREEHESRIAELQAAVNGLTEELVETKERLRLLELEVDEQRSADEPTAEPQSATSATEPTESAATDDADATNDGDETDEPTVREWTTKSDDHVEVVRHERTEPESTPADEAGSPAASDSATELTADTESGSGDTATDADGETEDADEQNDIIVA